MYKNNLKMGITQTLRLSAPTNGATIYLSIYLSIYLFIYWALSITLLPLRPGRLMHRPFPATHSFHLPHLSNTHLDQHARTPRPKLPPASRRKICICMYVCMYVCMYMYMYMYMIGMKAPLFQNSLSFSPETSP